MAHITRTKLSFSFRLSFLFSGQILIQYPPFDSLKNVQAVKWDRILSLGFMALFSETGLAKQRRIALGSGFVQFIFPPLPYRF